MAVTSVHEIIVLSADVDTSTAVSINFRDKESPFHLGLSRTPKAPTKFEVCGAANSSRAEHGICCGVMLSPCVKFSVQQRVGPAREYAHLFVGYFAGEFRLVFSHSLDALRQYLAERVLGTIENCHQLARGESLTAFKSLAALFETVRREFSGHLLGRHRLPSVYFAARLSAVLRKGTDAIVWEQLRSVARERSTEVAAAPSLPISAVPPIFMSPPGVAPTNGTFGYYDSPGPVTAYSNAGFSSATRGGGPVLAASPIVAGAGAGALPSPAPSTLDWEEVLAAASEMLKDIARS